MSAVWEDVKGRKIFKVATYYAAVTWGIIQIADILLPVLRYPEWVMSSMVLVAFSGFPVALIIGWMFDIRLERQNQTNPDQPHKSSSSFSSRVIEFSIILAFGSGATLLYFNTVNQPAVANIEPLPSIQSITEVRQNQKTIAVLPFASFGSSAEDVYFADGLSEELLNVLAKNKSLRVAARTSSFQYKNKNINVKTIASELGVQYILEGSVRRSGNQIRVTAQLIKADEDVHIFSSTWDKDTTNIFKVQDEIAQSVLETLEIKLLGKSELQKSDIGTQDIAAFAEYSRGVAFVRNRTKDDFDNAIVHLKKALEFDVNYAEANAMLAEAYLLQLSYGLISREKAFELAKPNIEKALSVNRELPEGHAVMGLLHWQMANGKEDDPQEAEEELKQAKFHLNKAIELNPSNAEAYMWYGSILQNEGLLADGSKLFEKAFEIDPQAAVVGYNRGLDLVRTGQYEEAMAVFNTVVRNNPNYANAYQIAGDVSYSVGQLDQAYSMYKRIADLSGNDTEWLLSANQILIPIGRFEQAQQNLDKANETENEKYQMEMPQLQAKLWLAANKMQKFYAWVDSIDEDSTDWGDQLWRGFAALSKHQWKYAAQDLEKSLKLLKGSQGKRRDHMTVRIQLMLARAWQGAGDKLRSESYLKAVESEIKLLISRQSIGPQILRYNQAAHAAISNNTLQALGLLRQAVQEGFVDIWMVKSDPSFDSIREDPTFAAILREFDSKMRLMRNNIENSQNKFALGE